MKYIKNFLQSGIQTYIKRLDYIDIKLYLNNKNK